VSLLILPRSGCGNTSASIKTIRIIASPLVVSPRHRWPFRRATVGCFAAHPFVVLPHTHSLFCRNRYAVKMNNATGNA